MRARRRSTPTTRPTPIARPILRLRLASLLAAQLFDFGTFTYMVGQHGIRAEANPIVAGGFLAFGLPVVAVMKLALVVLVSAVVVMLGREAPIHPSTPRLATLVTVMAVVAGLAGGLSNVRPR